MNQFYLQKVYKSKINATDLLEGFSNCYQSPKKSWLHQCDRDTCGELFWVVKLIKQTRHMPLSHAIHNDSIKTWQITDTTTLIPVLLSPAKEF